MTANSPPNLLERLTDLLSRDDRLVSEGKLLKNKVTELALNLDASLLQLLLTDSAIKAHFFTEVDTILVFDKIKFQKFVNNKQFLPDSYTAYKNKIGLTANDEYLTDSKEVVLSFPYKDCILEGGQDKEDAKRDEVFWNQTLAPDQIDRLLSPKLLTNFKRFDKDGEHTVTEIKPTDNLIIKGNNLLALHTLESQFAGKVKLIYIDPPYNTDGDSFLYNDSFNHSTWLTFMRNRLSIAKSLLSKDGVIFIHCDYIEFGYLKVLMDEIFGAGKALPHITVKTSTPAGFKVVNPGLVNVAEHILVYCMGDKKSAVKNSYVKAGYQSDYKYVITNKSKPANEWMYKNIRDLVTEENPNIQKESLVPLIEQFALKNPDRVFATYGPHKPSERMKEGIKLSKESPTKIVAIEREDGGQHYLLNGRLIAFYESKLKVVDGELCPTQRLTDFWSDLSWDSIANEGGVSLKNGKKPERLLKRLIEITSNPNDLVLDFHLGSGTTCAVAHKLGRQYIGIEQLDYGQNDSVIRLKNVINADSTGISKTINWQGGGSFVYCELAKANQAFVDAITEATTTDELSTIWQDMKNRAFISYKVDVKKIDATKADFAELSLDDQKRFLIATLDQNMLYIPLSEMDDVTFGVSEADKALNKQFFNLGGV